VAGVRRPDGEVLDTKGSRKYRESAETVVLPRRSRDQGEYGGEVFGVKASWSSANSLPEFLCGDSKIRSWTGAGFWRKRRSKIVSGGSARTR
jgi:hypothetical protein